MRSLFRSFERFEVAYLLISGQAAILYGAATFSEDIDIWIRPTPENATRLTQALAACRARVYKLTPPITRRNLMTGHGFHFVVPTRGTPAYLDVMGRPPRVGSFSSARHRARIMRTPWGRLPVVSILDLIALKRTRRLSDYEVISSLVRIRLTEETPPSTALLRWALVNSFRVEDRIDFARQLGIRAPAEAWRRRILTEIARHQALDTAYWRRVIRDLRRLRRQKRLLLEGMPVSRSLNPAPQLNA
ncbi:MAG: hypothetical protein ACRELA_19080 [Candidatus Rokuibacteriota bacterium]